MTIRVAALDFGVNNQQSEANNFQKTLETINTISDDKNLHFLPGASFVAR